MDVFHSNWLIQMLKKTGDTPQARLLSLFDILDDWTDAPGMKVTINQHNISAPLKTYLTLEAARAGAALPEMLAVQLYFMALSAMQEKLLGINLASLVHAKNAAKALLRAQTNNNFRIARTSTNAIAASLIGALVVAGSLFLLYQPKAETPTQMALIKQRPSFQPSITIASAQSTAALISQIEQMHSGNCRLLEAIQLQDKYKSVYFQNIVCGQISTDPTEQILVRELLEKIRCNYTPMLMKKST